jgi:hypothetical protein
LVDPSYLSYCKTAGAINAGGFTFPANKKRRDYQIAGIQ